MNIWTAKSIQLANEGNYLDRLYEVYPMAENDTREIEADAVFAIKNAICERNDEKLISYLFKQDLFPVKDSYVAYLKRDRASIKRNPKMVKRITGKIYELGAEEVIKRITAPKETNRQIGPLFSNWLRSGALGLPIIDDDTYFLQYSANCIFGGTDETKAAFARRYLGYSRNKGLDFLAKIKGIFILGEAKFLTDFGGHQNAQFDDALSTMKSTFSPTKYNILPISILDGVLYIQGKNKMYTRLVKELGQHEVVISAVLLKEFIESI